MYFVGYVMKLTYSRTETYVLAYKNTRTCVRSSKVLTHVRTFEVLADWAQQNPQIVSMHRQLCSAIWLGQYSCLHFPMLVMRQRRYKLSLHIDVVNFILHLHIQSDELYAWAAKYLGVSLWDTYVLKLGIKLITGNSHLMYCISLITDNIQYLVYCISLTTDKTLITANAYLMYRIRIITTH